MKAFWCGEPIYEAAIRLRDSCLRRDGSLFTEGAPIWTRTSLAEVEQRIGVGDTGGESFIGRLEAQLTGLEPALIQLGAELLYVQMLSEADTHGAKAREHLARILGMLPEHLLLPADLDEALDHGGVAGFSTGKAYRYAHVQLIARVAAELKTLPEDRRNAALDDPWAFHAVMRRVRTSTNAMEANALLHLLFPDTFSYMVSETQRAKLIKTFGSLPGVAGAESSDRKIELIERAAARHATWRFNLYEGAVKAVWDEPPTPRWAEVVSWSKRLFDDESFDDTERTYKIELAGLISEARDALLADREDWIDLLRRAFRSSRNNLTDYRAHDRFLEWLTAHPAEGAAALELLWRDPDSEDPRINEFLAALPKEAVTGTGTRVSFASFLLLGIDPGRWPFFKPTPYERLCRLLDTSVEASRELDPEAVYRPDELAARLGLDGRRVRDFLRSEYPREVADVGSEWYLSADQAERVLDRFGAEVDPAAEEAIYDHFWTLLEQLRLRLLAAGTELRDMLDAQGLVWWFRHGHAPDHWSAEDRAAFAAFTARSRSKPAPGADAPAPATPATGDGFPAVTEQLAHELHLPIGWLQGALDLLERQRQLILYGPPGTGKTYIAQHIGRHLAAAGGSYRLVQFHPSYTYEDFFEGYRPRAGEGGVLAFDLVHGVLREIAETAREQPDRPHLLIIDEINRGNIAKIFGELYFLLEYRDAQIQLQYSRDEPFTLPPNLYIIGTMNTADRSIALVDSALRRRFYFLGLIPTHEPVDRVLSTWLAAHELDPAPATLLAVLNDAIADDDFAIGPSYFMTRDGSAPAVEDIWRHQIMPLLEEHYYGTDRDVESTFGLKAIRSRIAAAADEDEGDGID